MANLCDRCRVSGCLLDYLGKACQHARKRECPDVQYTVADYISDMTAAEMAEKLPELLKDAFKDGVPSKANMLDILIQPIDEES